MSSNHNRKSAFTKLLQLLGNYSEKLDNETLTHDDFTEFQRIEPRIIEAYQKGSYRRHEYMVLTGAYYYIKTKARILLRLDQGEET